MDRSLRTKCHRRPRNVVLVLVVMWQLTNMACAADPLVRVTFTDDKNEQRAVDGRILVEAQDGGLLMETPDGQLSTVTAKQLIEKQDAKADFQYADADELKTQLKAELGDAFETVQTKHYLICTNAGTVYAEWCGALFERLLAGFRTYWKNGEIAWREPTHPLVAVVFAERSQFAEYATKDAGPAIAKSMGYYSVRSNRIILFDLTAAKGSAPARKRIDVARKVAASPFNVATVVHEATHQIAFNSGMHRRYADNPLWLTEGMAMYFETPDLRNRTGWRTIGRVNRTRLKQFRDYVRNRRPANSLESLIANDARAKSPETAADAYAESWALTYFLLKRKRKQYEGYLKAVSAKPRLVWDDKATRLTEFGEAFGEDLEKLDAEFLRYTSRLR